MPVFTSMKSIHSAKDKGALETVLALQPSESGLGLMFQSMLNLLIEATTRVNGTQGDHRVCLTGHELREWLSCDVLCLGSDRHLVTPVSPGDFKGLQFPICCPPHTIVYRLELRTCSIGWVNNLFWILLWVHTSLGLSH